MKIDPAGGLGIGSQGRLMKEENQGRPLPRRKPDGSLVKDQAGRFEKLVRKGG